RRIYLNTIDARIIALDSRAGTLCRDFGDSGTVRLRRGLRTGPYYQEEYELTSPPAVISGMIVTGSATADNTRSNGASGEVRAYDARSGALKWTFDPVPQSSADPASQTWIGPNAHRTGAANSWTIFAADPVRKVVFVATSSPSVDYFGGERKGRNEYA